MNHYGECNSFSRQHDDFWESVYGRAFPDLRAIAICNDKADQLKGIDKRLLLSDRVLAVDEKLRAPNSQTGKEYDDISLEYISDDQMNTPGWIEKELAIDYLAYGFLKSKVAYLFQWHKLRSAWRKAGGWWKNDYPQVAAVNNWGRTTYTTISVAVPLHIILASVPNTIVVQA